MDIMQTLIEKYDYNEPIILKDVKLDGISDENIRQIFSRLVKSGQIERYDQGVYYIPKITPLGKSKIPAKKVYEKKFISDRKSTFGYYTGLTLQNAIGLTTQVPNTIEIVTNRVKSRLRELAVGSQKLRLRRARTTVTTRNAKALQLLELMNSLDVKQLSSSDKQALITYVRSQNIRKNDVTPYIPNFPAKVSKNLIESGIIDELTP
jgi:predicted transcriptional regulator of viral defense system